MAAISQTKFAQTFPWKKVYEVCLRFHWRLFRIFQLTNIPALVKIITWPRSGNKPLSEPMMISLLIHICIIWTQWVNSDQCLLQRLFFCFSHSLVRFIHIQGSDIVTSICHVIQCQICKFSCWGFYQCGYINLKVPLKNTLMTLALMKCVEPLYWCDHFAP